MKYVPASSFAVLNLTGQQDRRLYSEYKASPNWWEPNSFFKHKYMLITAFYGLDYPNFREKYNIPKEGFELMGDSVTGDSVLVFKEFGKIKTDSFKNFYEQRVTKNSAHYNNQWRNLVGVEVLSMDKNKQLHFKPATQIKRHKTNKRLYEIKTIGGRNITVTEDHSLFTIDDNYNVIEVKGSDIKKEDYIVGAGKLSLCEKEEQEEVEVILNSNHLNEELEQDILFLRVKDVKKKTPNEYVYDISVPETENFVANGLVAHNSGGFQNYKGDRGLQPLEVLRWQEANCDIGYSLDYPLLSTDELADIRTKNKHTVQNINDMIPKRENYDMDFYACTHGWSKKDIVDVHKQLPKEGINGWGIGECSASDDTPIGIMSRIALELSLNEERLPMHILGCCSPPLIGFFALIEKYYDITISYDSTAYSNGAMYRWYHLDGQKKDKFRVTSQMEKVSNSGNLDDWELSIQKSQEIPVCDLKELTCDCPICTNVKFSDMLGADSEAGTLVSLHNLWKEIEIDAKIKKLSENPEDLLDYLWESYGVTKTSYRKNYYWMLRAMKDFVKFAEKDELDEFTNVYYYKNKYRQNVSDSLNKWISGKEYEKELEKAEERYLKKPKVKKPKSKSKSKPKIKRKVKKKQEEEQEYNLTADDMII